MKPKEKAVKGMVRLHQDVPGEDNDWSRNDMEPKLTEEQD